MTLLLGCTICYGDPASPLSKGAIAGVLVLGVAIFCVAATFGGLFLFWMRRARALEAKLALASVPSTVATETPSPLPRVAPLEPPSLTLH